MSQISTSHLSAPLLWAALFGIGLAWGSTQLLSKLTVLGGHHPLGISFASTSLGAGIVTLVLLGRGLPLPLSRRHLVYYAICGLTGTAAPNYVSYMVISELPVGVVSIILVAVPMATFLAALLFRLERPEPRRFLGLGAGALAVVLLVLPEASLTKAGDGFWVLIALIPVLCYTIENIYIAKACPENTGALQTLCGLSWAALIFITPAAWVSGSWMDLGADPGSTWAMAAMTVMHLVAYGGFVWLIGRGGPVFAAQVSYVVTLTGVVLGIVALGEAHSGWVWASLVTMLAGLALVQPRQA